MLSKEYLETARTILRAAQTMTDQHVAGQLKALAEDYERRAEKAAHFGLQGDPLVHVTKFSAYRSDQNIPCRSVARFTFFRDFSQIGQCFLSSIGHPRLRCRACECSEAPTGIA